MADPITVGHPQKLKRGNPNYTGGFWAFFGILAVAFVLFLPLWPFSVDWGYYPSAGIGFVMLLFLVYVFMGAFIGRKPTSTPMGRRPTSTSA